MEDKQIVSLYWERKETAIRETEKKYGKLCYGLAKKILGNDADAEECVNDAYLGIWNALPPARPHSLMAFTAKIVRNLALKRRAYNCAQKRNAFETVALSDLEEVLADEAAFADADEEELGHIISDFLRTEKEDARNVFLRKYWFFDSVEEIAGRYGFSESKVKSMLFQTRNRLKQYLHDKGVHV